MSVVERHPDGGVLIGGVHHPDDMPLAEYEPGMFGPCRNCASQLMAYSLPVDARFGTDRERRVRLLHHDENCPCFAVHCACAPRSAAITGELSC